MNNEPVAWMQKLQNYVTGETVFSFEKERIGINDIPLYTNPAKTLTDGIELLEKYADKLEDERPNKGLSDVVLECVNILKKASEK